MIDLTQTTAARQSYIDSKKETRRLQILTYTGCGNKAGSATARPRDLQKVARSQVTGSRGRREIRCIPSRRYIPGKNDFCRENDRITAQAQCNQRPNQDSQCRIERASRKSNIHFSICTSNTTSFIHLTIGEGLGIKAMVVFALGWGS